jgi:DNA-binding CsgD family transcriptional regulator
MGDVQQARSASRELADVAATIDTETLCAMAAHSQGAVELAEGDAQAALGSLRRAFEAWQQVQAPYAVACVRTRIGLACRSLGDEETARLEFGAARATFQQLGAAPDLARLDTLDSRPVSTQRHLSGREVQVLRLVAAGKTNKAIAAELSLSERTIDRHVANILRKLDVPSRAAAAAHAYRDKLV